MAQIIDGRALAAASRDATAKSVAQCIARGFTPGLAVVMVGEDPASQVYVRNKAKACAAAGIAHQQHTLPSATTEAELLQLIAQLNADTRVHGILVQLPLPDQMHDQTMIAAIDPAKDVDGFHPINAGKLALGLSGPRPCTPVGVMEMFAATNIELSGASAVVIGRSAIVGKPMAFLLLGAHATVTICHSRTRDIATVVRSADIVVAAVGRAHFVQGDWIKPGATVVDVGINRTAAGTLVGDVDPSAATHAAHITPVPGGVGPMTIAMLLKNTVLLAKAQCEG